MMKNMEEANSLSVMDELVYYVGYCAACESRKRYMENNEN